MSETQTSNAPLASRQVLVAGATGLVGNRILWGLLADATVEKVHVLCRRALTVRHARLIEHCVDYAALPDLPVVNEVYLALGTTLHQAGSRDAFRAVDFALNLAVARAAQAAGVRRIGLVSAMGANARAHIFYNRVKGELEEVLGSLDLDALVIARPSLLLGDRDVLGQPERRAERLAQRFGKALGVLLPGFCRPIAADKVARALLEAVPRVHGQLVLSSADMQAVSS